LEGIVSVLSFSEAKESTGNLMSGVLMDEPTYILGHSEKERQRLIAQSSLYGSFTEKLLIQAGIGKGMRVLDIGCGMGDVSLLTARIVGPEGAVVGVDREEVAVKAARERACGLGLGSLSFVAGDPQTISFDRPFDGLIGRFVLMYQADPAVTLASLCKKLVPGGIVAFHELEFTDPPGLLQNPTWKRCFTWWKETAVRAGIEVHMGSKMYSTFIGAGLAEPSLEMFTPMGAGPHFGGYEYVAESIRSILPLMEQLGVATASEVDTGTLSERLRADTLSAGGVLVLPHTVGAWARVR
jgi:ubiquinone/menaquinone biosynthesis C-methylase UbiE